MPSQREQIVELLKTCYDPEIPFNIVDLGLVYGLDINQEGVVKIKMTLTSPGCPVGPWLVDGIVAACLKVKEIKKVDVEIVFDPPWSPEMMSVTAHEALGF